MGYKITGVNWGSIEKCTAEHRPIVIGIEGLMVRVMVDSLAELEKGCSWEIKVTVIGVTTCQGKEKKVDLLFGTKLKGMLFKDETCPDLDGNGWLEIESALVAA